MVDFFFLTPLVMHEAGSVLFFKCVRSVGTVARLECFSFLFILVMKSSGMGCSRIGSGGFLEFGLEPSIFDWEAPKTLLTKSVLPFEILAWTLM